MTEHHIHLALQLQQSTSLEHSVGLQVLGSSNCNRWSAGSAVRDNTGPTLGSSILRLAMVCKEVSNRWASSWLECNGVSLSKLIRVVLVKGIDLESLELPSREVLSEEN